MGDVIARLRLEAALLCTSKGRTDQSSDVVLLREAAAAIEAAREDGLRLEWLADNMHMIARCSGLWFSSDGGGPYQDSTLRGAIDQARGIVPEAGQEVGK